MVITKEWLEKEGACESGKDWFLSQKETDGLEVVKKLIEDDRLPWADWLIIRIMTYKQYVSYAVFAAEQVIDIYEKEYPDDKRPRQAIKAVKKCIDDPSDENKWAAAEAAEAVGAAVKAAWAAAWAAEAAWAAWAARAAVKAVKAAWAARAAGAAVKAAEAAGAAGAAWAARAAAEAAGAAGAAGAAMQKKILNYGIKLLQAIQIQL